MLYVIAGLSLMFFMMAFIITENNATYLLNGYNTMSEEERKTFDLKGFIRFYRNLHFVLAGSFFVLSLAITRLENETWLGLFITTYPVLVYMYMIRASNRFGGPERYHKWNNAGFWVLAVVLLIMIALIVLPG